MSTVVTTVKWAWAAVDAATPAPPGVIGIDGTTLVVSVATADGQDVSDVLAGLTPGDIVSVADQATGGPVSLALDDLTDVDVSLSATGMLLTKQLDGSWKGANFTRPLNWLTDVVAPADAQGVLGTTAPGQWEPLPMDHLQQQIVGPLPGQVAALDQRIAALEVTPEPAPVDHALTVDNYAGGFTRLIGAQVIGTDPVRITVSLATTPGVNGTVFPDLSAISGSANVWADFAGTLGRVEDALTGTPIHGAALKEVIRRGTVVICHRDNTDPAHPTLKVDGTEAAGQPGTSLTLASLADVDNAAATAPAGKVLGTTAVGEWGPVTPATTDLTPLTTRVALVEQSVARLELDDLLDVTAPASTPAGKALATTGVGAWGVVDLPDGLPPTALPAPYVFKAGGVQGPGQATLMNGVYVIAHNTDGAGTAQAWQAALAPGDSFVFGPAGSPWSGAVGSVNAAEGGIPQQLVDTFVASGMTLIHPATGFPPAPAADAAIVFGGSDAGKVLTVGAAGPGWEPVPAAPAPSLALDALTDVTAPADTPTGKMLGTTGTGAWGPVDAPAGVPVPAPENLSQFLKAGLSGSFFWSALPAPVAQRLDWLADVAAPTNTPAGKVLGTTATGVWGPVDPPASVDSWGRWVGTRAEYDALPTKDATVLYVITP